MKGLNQNTHIGIWGRRDRRWGKMTMIDETEKGKSGEGVVERGCWGWGRLTSMTQFNYNYFRECTSSRGRFFLFYWHQTAINRFL